jgi:hypothetical protein
MCPRLRDLVLVPLGHVARGMLLAGHGRGDDAMQPNPLVRAEQGAPGRGSLWAVVPEANFSRAILAATPACLAVSRLPDVTWSDLGSPRRVMQIITRLGMTPAWAGEAVPGRS